jgi:asparagine synthase (glutamine-hydrolysing)
MCGIHGIINTKGDTHETLHLVRKMGRAQQHRGPDNKDQIAIPLANNVTIGLGFVRLEILDLQTGMQPITNQRSGSTIVCNGQIYNYKAIKQEIDNNFLTTRGDIEVALHLYDKTGLEFLHKLNGMYAGAIFDPNRKQLILFNDRFGIKPLYFTKKEGGFYFASEIKSIRAALPTPLSINKKALPLYLMLGYVPGEMTLYEGVYRLEPGSCLIYDLATGCSETFSYWSYSPEVQSELQAEDTAEKLTGLLEDAVQLRLNADVPVGSLISSGIDSCAVSTIASKLNPQTSLYSIGFENEDFDESLQVHDFVLNWLGAESHDSVRTTLCKKNVLHDLPEIIHHLDEPLSKTVLLPTWQLLKIVGEKHKVVLTGEGADELFAGYSWFWLDSTERNIDHFTKDPIQLYSNRQHFFDAKEISSLLNSEYSQFKLPKKISSRLDRKNGLLEMLLQLEIRCRLPASNLMRLDKLSMAHSVEARTPFLDYRIAELASTLQPDLKLGSRRALQKKICRDAFLKKSILPESITKTPKQPFCAPIDDWLRDSKNLPDFLREILIFRHSLFEDVIDPSATKKLISGYQADRTTPFTDVTLINRLWTLCVLAVWYDQAFVQN